MLIFGIGKCIQTQILSLELKRLLCVTQQSTTISIRDIRQFTLTATIKQYQAQLFAGALPRRIFLTHIDQRQLQNDYQINPSGKGSSREKTAPYCDAASLPYKIC